jgi:hypothetical protein
MFPLLKNPRFEIVSHVFDSAFIIQPSNVLKPAATAGD